MAVTAKEFYSLFIEALSENERKTLETYTLSREWTRYCIDVIKGVLENKDLKTKTEYFLIDLIAWRGNADWGGKSHKKNSDLKITERRWDLEVAIEHENDECDWTDEVIKLCHIKCGLKAVIGYAKHKERKKDMDKLDVIAGHMNHLRYGRLGEGEEFLVILGNCGKGVYESMGDIQFEAYVFNGKQFEPLK